MLSSLAPARRRVVLGALGLLLAVGLALALLPTVGGSSEDDGRVAQDVVGPVVLVPGYGGSTASLQVLADRLRVAGREVAVVQLPGDGRGDLRAAADALDARVRELERAGTPPVDVVGFSAGGVTARLWAATDGEGRARRVVTLGSPHHGAAVASYAAALVPGACPPGCRQLQPGSELLRRLNVGDETPDGPAWVSIYSDDDEVVTPPESARLEGSVVVRVQDVCPGLVVRHGELATEPVPVGLVVDALTGPPFTEPPSSDDCGGLRALGG